MEELGLLERAKEALLVESLREEMRRLREHSTDLGRTMVQFVENEALQKLLVADTHLCMETVNTERTDNLYLDGIGCGAVLLVPGFDQRNIDATTGAARPKKHLKFHSKAQPYRWS